MATLALDVRTATRTLYGFPALAKPGLVESVRAALDDPATLAELEHAPTWACWCVPLLVITLNGGRVWVHRSAHA